MSLAELESDTGVMKLSRRPAITSGGKVATATSFSP